MINAESIKKLAQLHKQDEDIIGLLQKALLSFENYHSAIYTAETHLKLCGFDEEAAQLDRSRTSAHNAVIANLQILNRLAERSGIPLVYEGIVSEERPHRVAIADAVLAYVEEQVKRRNK